MSTVRWGLVALLVLGSACGSGSSTSHPADAGPDAIEGGSDGADSETAPLDTGGEHSRDVNGGDSTAEDVTVDAGQDTPDADVPNPPEGTEIVVTDVPADTEIIVDVPVDTEVDVPASVCPCDQTVSAPVCLESTWTTYTTDVCAKCSVCKDDPATCPGCTGTVDCQGAAGKYYTYRGACGDCLCTDADECTLVGYAACGAFCGHTPDGGPPASAVTPDATNTTTYASACDLIHAALCKGFVDGTWNAFISTYGACPSANECPACAAQPVNPICAKDASGSYTYDNMCGWQTCGVVAHPSATPVYNGACLGPDYCPACASPTPTPADAVCGKDGMTYANACAAACKGTTVDYAGPCCTECAGDTSAPVCGSDGVLYPNECQLTCRGPDACPTTGAGACGVVGHDFPNDCQAQCAGEAILHEGHCKYLCEPCLAEPAAPGCGVLNSVPMSFNNACYATCLGGTITQPGALCVASCTSICGTIASPDTTGGWVMNVCGQDGTTYPTSCFPTKCFGITYTSGACPPN